MLKIEATVHEGAPSLRLEGELTIYSVGEARSQLEAALNAQPCLRLNLSALEEVDTAGVQLLVWLKHEAQRRDKTLLLYAHSPAVVDVFDLLKVAALFGDPILIAPSVS
jgi:anti-anti-sigma factor